VLATIGSGAPTPPDSPCLGAQPVKSAFELPWAAELPVPRRHAVLHGRSWSGHGPIRRVDVSLDGGATWRRAQLRPGDGGRGNTQPDTVPFNDGGYQFGAVARHPVTVV
jgi:hypothetical protein